MNAAPQSAEPPACLRKGSRRLGLKLAAHVLRAARSLVEQVDENHARVRVPSDSRAGAAARRRPRGERQLDRIGAVTIGLAQLGQPLDFVSGRGHRREVLDGCIDKSHRFPIARSDLFQHMAATTAAVTVKLNSGVRRKVSAPHVLQVGKLSAVHAKFAADSKQTRI